MSHNTFGKMLRLTTWGESHGEAIGCVLDGCPPNIELSIDEIQSYLDKRKPGQSKYTTQRKEDDKIEILSGTIKSNSGNHLTTGTPISLLIKNKDQRSRDYGEINDKFRPGHADFTYIKKYGLRDYRGGGRSSARETAMRVAGGAIARKIIPDIRIRAALVQMGPHEINRNNWDWDLINKNPFFCPDPEIIDTWEKYLQNRSYRRKCTEWSGRANLRKTRPRNCLRNDVDKRSKGSRDWSRLQNCEHDRQSKCRSNCD